MACPLRYRAVNAQGKSVSGRVEAINLFDLEQRLSRMGSTSSPARPRASPRASAAGASRARTSSTSASTWSSSPSAGVPLVEGLADLRDSLENPRFREVVSA